MHHFILLAHLAIALTLPDSRRRQRPLNWNVLREDPTVAREFDSSLSACMGVVQRSCPQGGALDVRWQQFASSAVDIAQRVLPAKAAQAARPWISEATLHLIQLRNAARMRNDRGDVLLLNRRIRNAARNDRKRWLEGQLVSGDWREIRKLSKGNATLGRLKDRSGNVVSTEARAETLAEYYERV